MRGRARWLVALVGALLLLAVLPGGAAADLAPRVEYEWVSNRTTGDATLHASIDPGGSKAGVYYQFQIVKNADEYPPGIVCPERTLPPGNDTCGPVPLPESGMPIGFIAGGSPPQSVSQDVAAAGIALQPNTTYHYRVIVVRRVLTEDTLEWEGEPLYGADETFTTPAAEAPTVEAESVSRVTATDATLEATINPQDANPPPENRGALYQFQLVTDPSEYLDEFTCTAECFGKGEEGLPFGRTDAGVSGQGVSLDLAKAGVTLKPGTTYHYRVITARYQQGEEGPSWEGPISYGPDQTFTTPPSDVPVIESVSVSHLTETDATLEATINTEGESTSYEFELWSSPCSHHGSGCELLIDIPLPSGLLLGSFVPQTVNLDLNSAGVMLTGGEYGVSLRATNKEGSATKSAGVFEPPTAGAGSLQPVIPPTPPAPVAAPITSDQVIVGQTSAGPTSTGQTGTTSSGQPAGSQSSSTPEVVKSLSSSSKKYDKKHKKPKNGKAAKGKKHNKHHKP